MTLRASGPAWCDQFPGSHSPEDLVEPFRSNWKRFAEACRAAGMSVTETATLRPRLRAWLMHYACWVAGFTDKHGVHHQILPSEVPATTGLDIDWTHGGAVNDARVAAAAMVAKYGIVYPAALDSLHIQGRAVDATILWRGTVDIVDGHGVTRKVTYQPNDKVDPAHELWAIGATFGVFKLASDRPHWSDNGH